MLTKKHFYGSTVRKWAWWMLVPCAILSFSLIVIIVSARPADAQPNYPADIPPVVEPPATAAGQISESSEPDGLTGKLSDPAFMSSAGLFLLSVLSFLMFFGYLGHTRVRMQQEAHYNSPVEIE